MNFAEVEYLVPLKDDPNARRAESWHISILGSMRMSSDVSLPRIESQNIQLQQMRSVVVGEHEVVVATVMTGTLKSAS